MKKRRKKVVFFSLAGMLILGMGVSLSMGMALGSLTSALFEPTPPPTAPADAKEPEDSRGTGTGALDKTPVKDSNKGILKFPIPVVAKAATPPRSKRPSGGVPALPDLWNKWTPDDVEGDLHSRRGHTYAGYPSGSPILPPGDPYNGTGPTHDPDWDAKMTADFFTTSVKENHEFFTAATSSFSSSGGSLTVADNAMNGNAVLTNGPRAPNATPVPPSVILLGSGFLAMIGVVRRRRRVFKNKKQQQE